MEPTRYAPLPASLAATDQAVAALRRVLAVVEDAAPYLVPGERAFSAELERFYELPGRDDPGSCAQEVWDGLGRGVAERLIDEIVGRVENYRELPPPS